MPKKRRLTDLYIVGQEVVFDDGQGDPVTVYVRKLSPVDHETALRNANAARSRASAVKTEVASDEHEQLKRMVDTYSVEDLVSYLVEDRRQNRKAVIEARVADEEEWSKENYLQGLHDSWNDTLQIRAIESPDDSDVVRVRAELDRYEATVDAELKAETDDLEVELGDRPTEQLRDQVLDKVIDVRSAMAWITEYRRCEVWLSVRELDRKTRYFENRQEVDELPLEIFDRLSATYMAISVDTIEGKGSAETPPSSPSSEQPESPETDGSSGQKSAAA